MTIAESFLAEFEGELAATRRHLERVPEDKLNWKPAEASMTLGQLALHIAASPGGVSEMALADEVPLPEMSEGFPQPASVAEILSALEESNAKVRANLKEITDARCAGELKLLTGDAVVAVFPRLGFLRNVLMNHTYHHRGQISVYLRLLGVPVPSTYGPTADEAFIPQGAEV